METELDKTFETRHISKENLEEAALKLTGEIEQTPPVFSALKKDGKRLYEYARKGEDVKLESRPVTIHKFEVDAPRFPEVDFKIVCSKGTYIRSMANDFGIALGSGAYLSSLKRTRVGEFAIDDALDLSSFQKLLPSA
jgi:tRNA pseudouridine55 synthase